MTDVFALVIHVRRARDPRPRTRPRWRSAQGEWAGRGRRAVAKLLCVWTTPRTPGGVPVEKEMVQEVDARADALRSPRAPSPARPPPGSPA